MSHGAGAAGTTTEFREYQWAYSVMDSSRVSTCLISMLLIVYGSFRSLNMEQEQREREKKRQNDSMNNLLTGEPVQQEQSKLNIPSHIDGGRLARIFFSYPIFLILCWIFFFPKIDKFATLDTMHALCLPLGASVSLLVMFFFFDSMQMLFAVCTAIIATVALAFLLLPMCQYIIRPCSDGNRISFGFCGRFTAAELFSFSLAVSIVCIWVLTGHWLLMDGRWNW